MSSSADLDNDDYVAKLLTEDARKSSIRYASMGTYALMAKRPANAAPKPNTRFLKTLVREADNHNAALKKKEELEARIRLRNLRGAKDSHTVDRDTVGQRRRHSHPHRERGSEGKRHMSDDEEGERNVRYTRNEKERSDRRSRSPERDGGGDERSRRRARKKHSDDYSGKDDREKRSHNHQSSNRPLSRLRSRSREIQGKDRGRLDRKIRHSHRDSAARPEQRRLDNEDETHRSQHTQRRSRSSSSSSSASSDPLPSLIGPRPRDNRTTRRGRGFSRNPRSSNIDAHFSSSYDPSLDVDTEEKSYAEGQGGGDDWDNALEALRDRRAWKAKQTDRMREAGFDEDEIKRWEASSARPGIGDGDFDIRHVKWRKPGEGREWDAGKTQDEPDEVHRQGGASSTPAQRGSVVGALEKAWRGPENGLLKQFRNALG
ncbi:hypothetical protein A1O3_07865 [Capronia epimyces CBS 606.96]|uniref:Pre-mRNA-splicing factor 38B n=1 Tax=Capronia epimyces CBS 606.96 TaxID=1182542 RepID=W9XRG9_9EURO|nr:uncharacterized protein A1O3_07865 [Capronia epimyces CBS 606.96]EXJ79586.1 hypothetical protein A1O3_07865 [Capronia epimyces CBS 606.96]